MNRHLRHFLLLVDDSEAVGPNPINAKIAKPLIIGVAGLRIERSGVQSTYHSLAIPHVHIVRISDQ